MKIPAVFAIDQGGGRARHRQKAIFRARETDITKHVIVGFERHAAPASRPLALAGTFVPLMWRVAAAAGDTARTAPDETDRRPVTSVPSLK